jgi:hypothetical protein
VYWKGAGEAGKRFDGDICDIQPRFLGGVVTKALALQNGRR